MTNKHHKKKRQRPALKKKKVRKVVVPSPKKAVLVDEQFREVGKMLMKSLEDKDAIKAKMAEEIKKIEAYFRRYDSIKLLGSVGLYLINNMPTLEKQFMAQMSGKTLKLDEDAEVIAEYALNFAFSVPNDGTEAPNKEVVADLRESLRGLYKAFGLIDMPLENDATQFIDWIIHSETIAVRGDGYSDHLQEVFKELFLPHSVIYRNRYGFTIEQLQSFLIEIEDRLICKLGSQEMVYGPYKMWDRWRKWEERTYGPMDEEEDLMKRDFSKGMFGDFFEANPDVPHSEDGQYFLLIPPDDYTESDKIFWVYPQNDVERNILRALSVEFGDNASFIAEGEYKGNIMNGHNIYEKPFVKVGDRYYCFTPMLTYRNMFLIAEKLMMCDAAYYNQHFKNNTSPIGRDNYVEDKVKRVMQSFLPNVHFYSSVKYHVVEDGVEKKPELDILGVSNKATYIIEVKAHELTHKDRVGLAGAKEKFRNSVVEACYQSQRAKTFVDNAEPPVFTQSATRVQIDKTKPVYKIAVTFQHYSTLLGQMDKLVEAGLMKDEYRDTWIVSLFDLMVCADFFEYEDEFISYLEMHKTIYSNHSTFNDELDLLGKFLNEDFAKQVKPDSAMIIIGGHENIDEEYAKDFKLPIK